MDFRNLEKLVETRERSLLEFKKQLSTNQQKDICKEFAAFASSSGGQVVVGVEDDRTMIGLSRDVSKEIRSKIQSWIPKRVKPEIKFDIRIIDKDNRFFILISIESGDQPIYYYDNKPYIRNGESSDIATPEQVKDRILGWEVRHKIEEILGDLEKNHPSRNTAAYLSGQSELATMSYQDFVERLLEDFPGLADFSVIK